MAEHKRQHYVPRCHFKPFSANGTGDAVNLFNLNSKKVVQCAPIKGQCARDYIYGEDLALEKALQHIEGEYARVVRMVQADARDLGVPDVEVLRFFASIQHFRTEAAMSQYRDAHEGLVSALFDGRSAAYDRYRPNIPDDREMMRESVKVGVKTAPVWRDLKACLVVNEAKYDDFITSDNPAVFTSRYYIQRLRSSNFGMSSSGAILVLPLSPSHLILFYDGNVYTIPDKRVNTVSISKSSDVLALNELQYLSASKNIYFSNYTSAQQIKAEYDGVQTRRPTARVVHHIFVPDEAAPAGTERYRRATGEEVTSAAQTIVTQSVYHPQPGRWLSKLQYRSNPRTYCNGSLVGHLRKREWLSGGLDRELGRARPDPYPNWRLR